jgi:hypothetical protein
VNTTLNREHGKKRRLVRGANRLLGCAAVAGGLSMIPLAVGAHPAGATLWSGSVTLNGAIQCPAYGGPFDTVKWVWVSGSNGDSGWASHGSGERVAYSFAMNHVPSGGAENVTVEVGCAATGQHNASFGVNRPVVGSYATRNITF